MFVLLQFLGIKVTPYLFSELRISFDFGSTLQDLACMKFANLSSHVAKLPLRSGQNLSFMKKRKSTDIFHSLSLISSGQGLVLLESISEQK